MLARTTTTPFRQLFARTTTTSSSTTTAALRPISTTRLTFASTQLTARRSISNSARNMSELKKIFTDKACPPAGPYSQAVAVGAHLFVSGQIPADASGNLVTGSIAVQTEACCKNIAAILEAAGTTVEKVFKVNVFLDDMANFGEMNGVYEKFFAHKPARSCVAVKQLPKGVPVEIECIALS